MIEQVKIELSNLYDELYKTATRKGNCPHREKKMYELHRQINAVERYLGYLSGNPPTPVGEQVPSH